jgi:hypothetical protein
MPSAGQKPETILVIFFRGNMLLVGPRKRLKLTMAGGER